MMTSKFVVGQAVNFSKKYPWMSGGPYEVVSVLPPDRDDSTTYRVKSQVEPFARAANEADLIAVDLAPVGQTAPVGWADLLSQRSGPTRSR
jgi:hypothetical protein